jgi:GTP-binding protein HflX
MNRLTDADVKALDQLFATLDTRTRRWQLPHWGPVLLSDSVGFIRDLPHKLIASFKATLEESRQSDLLLHVADVSNPYVLDQIGAVFDVLEELEIESKMALLVLNKIDACDDRSRVQAVLNRYPYAIAVSAHTGEGLDRLATAVSDALSSTFVDVDIDMSVANGKLMAYVAAHGEVLSKQFDEQRVRIHCRMPQKYLGRIRLDDVRIVPRQNGDSRRKASSVVDANVGAQGPAERHIEDVA